MTDLRRLEKWGYVLAAVLGGAALVWWPGVVWRWGRGPAPGGHILAATATAALGMIWVMFFGLRIWRRQDEFLQQGAKFAWYWGGTIGLMATVPAYQFVGVGGLHWLAPQIPATRELGRAFVMGYGLAFLGLWLGVMGAALIWRLRNR